MYNALRLKYRQENLKAQYNDELTKNIMIDLPTTVNA